MNKIAQFLMIVLMAAGFAGFGQVGKSYKVASPDKSTFIEVRTGVGNAAGPVDWRQNISLDFLSKGKAYTATIFEDDGQGSIRKRRLRVKKGDLFSIDLPKETGQAIMIAPVKKSKV